MLIKSPYTNSQIYSSRNIFPNNLTDWSQPIRSSASSADPADVELVSQHRPIPSYAQSVGLCVHT